MVERFLLLIISQSYHFTVKLSFILICHLFVYGFRNKFVQFGLIILQDAINRKRHYTYLGLGSRIFLQLLLITEHGNYRMNINIMLRKITELQTLRDRYLLLG